MHKIYGVVFCIISIFCFSGCLSVANPVAVVPAVDCALPDIANCLAFNPNAKQIVAGCKDGSFKIVETDDGKISMSKQLNRGPIESVAYNVEGNQIVFQTQEVIRILDSKYFAEKVDIPSRTGTFVKPVVYSPDGKMILAGFYTSDYEKDMSLYDFDTKSSYTPKEQASFSGMLRFWDIENGSVRRNVFLVGKSVTVTRTGPSSNSLKDDLSSSASGLKSEGLADMPNYLTYSNDGTKVLAGFSSGLIKVYNANNGALLDTIFPTGKSSSISVIAGSPNMERMAIGYNNGLIIIYDFKQQKMRILQRHNNHITALMYSADGRYIISGSTDKTIRVWDANKGKEELATIITKSKIQALIYSPDSKWIASSHSDKTVKLWDINSLGINLQ
jgi:WD40 repeat protein